MIDHRSACRPSSRRIADGRAIAVALALALLAVVPACSGAGLSLWPFGGHGDAEVPASAVARPAAGLQAVAVRVREEDERAALRIAALANEALTRHGIRPEATAPNVLFLRFERPRTLESRSGPKVGIVGRGGSSSETDLGLAIQIPLDGTSPSPPPARHEVFAELENRGGNVIWRGRAVTDAVPTTEIDAAVARDLIERVVAQLARETGADSGGPGP